MTNQSGIPEWHSIDGATTFKQLHVAWQRAMNEACGRLEGEELRAELNSIADAYRAKARQLPLGYTSDDDGYQAAETFRLAFVQQPLERATAFVTSFLNHCDKVATTSRHLI